MADVITLDELNALSPESFTAALGAIFEHSPWIARAAAAARPFRSRLQLLDTMRAVLEQSSADAQRALIQAHPQLGVRGTARASLTAASAREQRRAGLQACTADELARLAQLNARYQRQFGFPFILAVRGHDPASIIANCEQRLAHDGQQERRTALAQIGLIAGYRLADVIVSSAAAEILAMLERLAMLHTVAAGNAAGSAAGSATANAGSAGIGGLVREWMLAAGLEVCVDAGGSVLGLRRSGRPGANTLLTGVHYDPLRNGLCHEGWLGFVVAIAVSQRLRQQAVGLNFDLAVLARTQQASAGDAASLSDADALRGCVALSDVEAANADAIETRSTLRAAGIDGAVLVLVREAAAGIRYRGEQTVDERRAEQAARVLEGALRQTGSPAALHG